MPSPTPPTRASGRLCIRAITAAVIARRISSGPKLSPLMKPCVGAVRMAVNADSAPAIPHASDDIRLAKMPDMRAASGLAAAARIARPYRDLMRKRASASTNTGDRNNMPEEARVTRSAPTLKTGCHHDREYSEPTDAEELT